MSVSRRAPRAPAGPRACRDRRLSRSQPDASGVADGRSLPLSHEDFKWPSTSTPWMASVSACAGISRDILIRWYFHRFWTLLCDRLYRPVLTVWFANWFALSGGVYLSLRLNLGQQLHATTPKLAVKGDRSRPIEPGEPTVGRALARTSDVPTSGPVSASVSWLCPVGSRFGASRHRDVAPSMVPQEEGRAGVCGTFVVGGFFGSRSRGSSDDGRGVSMHGLASCCSNGTGSRCLAMTAGRALRRKPRTAVHRAGNRAALADRRRHPHSRTGRGHHAALGPPDGRHAGRR